MATPENSPPPPAGRPPAATDDEATEDRPAARTADSAGTLTRHIDLLDRQPIIQAPPLESLAPGFDSRSELGVMVSLASGILPPEVERSISEVGGGLSDSALDRMQRDARFRLPRRQVRHILRDFCGDVDAVKKLAPHTMVIVAHQDDESIGMGGQISRLENVTVVHVTNGAPRSAAYARRFGFDHPDDYATARRREALNAMRLAGVAPERMLCLGIQDGEADKHMVHMSYLIAELLESLQPDVVVTHPYEGGHTDHDSISLAVQLACVLLRREGVAIPAVLELTSYYNQGGTRAVAQFLPFGPRDDARTLALPDRLRLLKAEMYRCFKTQQECLATFPTGLERFRPAPRYNYTKPPHDGPLDYERLTNHQLSGEAWRRRAYDALQHIRSGSSRPMPARISAGA